jgi:hypothetical protein
MAIAALVAWVLTALGGFVMLARWISHGGLRQQHDRATGFPTGLVFTHLGLAAAGLILWIVYLLTDVHRLAWVAFVLLVPVALLGFTMLARWAPTRRPVAVGNQGTTAKAVGEPEPAERHLPLPVVVAHGVFAVATVVLVLLTALGPSGS